MEGALHQNASTQRKIQTTCGVFWSGAPLQGTVAGIPSASSRTNDNSKRTQRAKARSHTASEIRTSSRHHRTHRQFGMSTQDFKSYFTFVRSSPYRLAPTMYCQLVEHNNRPMGAAGGQRIQVGASISSNSDVPTGSHGNQERSGLGGTRGAEATGQGSNKDSRPLPQPVSQQDISSSQEGWLLQASSQSEATESVHSNSALQDGESGHDERPAEGRRLDGFHRPEGCLSVGCNLGGAPELPEVYMEVHSVRVSVSSIRSKQCAQGLHQIVDACAGKTPSSRCSADHVFRRHAGW